MNDSVAEELKAFRQELAALDDKANDLYGDMLRLTDEIKEVANSAEALTRAVSDLSVRLSWLEDEIQKSDGS